MISKVAVLKSDFAHRHSHSLLRAHNLDCNLAPAILRITRADDRGEHAFAKVRKDLVAVRVELLA